MAGRIFAIQNDGTLHPMAEAPYADEDLFQRLLSDYPDLLAGEQINEASPRRWTLVSREVGVPLDAEGGDQFSVDHLFLDQDGVPTLVEVKRSSDHRIRREVVGQMLDYAAHAVAHWRAETIRGRFEGQSAQRGVDPMAQVAELMGADPATRRRSRPTGRRRPGPWARGSACRGSRGAPRPVRQGPSLRSGRRLRCAWPSPHSEAWQGERRALAGDGRRHAQRAARTASRAIPARGGGLGGGSAEP